MLLTNSVDFPPHDFILSLVGKMEETEKVLSLLCLKYLKTNHMAYFTSGVVTMSNKRHVSLHDADPKLPLPPVKAVENHSAATPGPRVHKDIDVVELCFLLDSSLSGRIESMDEVFKDVARTCSVSMLFGKFHTDVNQIRVSIQGGREDTLTASKRVLDLINNMKSNVVFVGVDKAVTEQLAPKWPALKQNITSKYSKVKTLELHSQQEKISISATEPDLSHILEDLDYHILVAENACEQSKRRQLADLRDAFSHLNLVEYGVGGLNEQFSTILRRTFQSRMVSPALRRELDLKHTKGILLHGEPGCGKTMIAKVVGEVLRCENVKYINSPEIESKWVGESEKNIREVFEEAIADESRLGTDSPLHIIIFDEIDAIVRERGGHNAKARDGALHQLLCEMDGLKEINNLIVFGLTNRIQDIDNAMLRPGRFEVHINIPLPDLQGRKEIFEVHTEHMRKNGRMLDVDLDFIAEATGGFNGAEIAAVVRLAQACAIESMQSEEDCFVRHEDIEKAVVQVRESKVNQQDKVETSKKKEDDNGGPQTF